MQSVYIYFKNSLKKIFLLQYSPCVTVFHIHFNDDIKIHSSVDHILFDYSPIIGHLGELPIFLCFKCFNSYSFSFFCNSLPRTSSQGWD